MAWCEKVNSRKNNLIISGDFILKFFVFLVVLVILGLLEKPINKLLGVEKKKISETPGKKVDRWGRGIILAVFLCALPFVIDADVYVMKWFLIFYFIILFGFQLVLEWKYLRTSKQYVTTFIFLLFGVIIMYNIEYLFWKNNVKWFAKIWGRMSS